ncbi:uncharacterized small protein (DUF1192 family) [Bradyrhizobium sp. GM6.1]
MSNDYEDSLSMDALNDRIAILEDNIRQLIEQAAAASGEQNESRIADRINQQNDELDPPPQDSRFPSEEIAAFRRRRMRPYAGGSCACAATAVSWTEIAGLT